MLLVVPLVGTGARVGASPTRKADGAQAGDPWPSNSTVPVYPQPKPLLHARLHVIVTEGLADKAVPLSRRDLAKYFAEVATYFVPAGIALEFDAAHDVEETTDRSLIDDFSPNRDVLDRYGAKFPGNVPVFLRNRPGTAANQSQPVGTAHYVDVSKDVGPPKIVHELGHYFGLVHVFDQVRVEPWADTVAVRTPITSPPECDGEPTWRVEAGTKLADGYVVPTPTPLAELIRSRVEARFGSKNDSAEAVKLGYEIRDGLIDGDGLTDTPPDVASLKIRDACSTWSWRSPPRIPLRVTFTPGSAVAALDFAWTPSTWNAMSYWDYCGGKTVRTWGFSASQAGLMRANWTRRLAEK